MVKTLVEPSQSRIGSHPARTRVPRQCGHDDELVCRTLYGNLSGLCSSVSTCSYSSQRKLTPCSSSKCHFINLRHLTPAELGDHLSCPRVQRVILRRVERTVERLDIVPMVENGLKIRHARGRYPNVHLLPGKSSEGLVP